MTGARRGWAELRGRCWVAGAWRGCWFVAEVVRSIGKDEQRRRLQRSSGEFKT